MTSYRLFIFFFLLFNATKVVAADTIYLPAKPCSLNSYYPVDTVTPPLKNPTPQESIIALCPSSDNIKFMLQYLKEIHEDNSIETAGNFPIGIYPDLSARKKDYIAMQVTLNRITQQAERFLLTDVLAFTERVIQSLHYKRTLRYNSASQVTFSQIKSYNLNEVEKTCINSDENKFIKNLFLFNNYIFEQLALNCLLEREKKLNIIPIINHGINTTFDLCFLQTDKGVFSFVINKSIKFSIQDVFIPTAESATGYTLITLNNQLSKESGIYIRENFKNQVEIFSYHGASSITPCTIKLIEVLNNSNKIWDKIEYQDKYNSGRAGFIPLMEEGNPLSSILSNIALLEELKESLRNGQESILTNAYLSVTNQKEIEYLQKEEEDIQLQQDHNIEQVKKIDATIEELSNQATKIIEEELTVEESQKIEIMSTWLPDPVKTGKKKKKTTGKKSKKPRVQEKNRNKKNNESNEDDKSKIEAIVPSLPKKTVAEIKKKAQKILASHKVENRLKMRTFYSVFNSIMKETDALTEAYNLDKDTSSTNIVGSHITIHGNEGAATFVKKHGKGDNEMRPNEVNTFFAKYLESRLKILSDN